MSRFNDPEKSLGCRAGGRLANTLFAAFLFIMAAGLASCPKEPRVNESAENATSVEALASSPSRTSVWKKCPEGMAWIPPAKVCIDLFEYPNVSGEIPLAGVDYLDALELCGKQGKRLPTAGEWERACAGPEKLDYLYPYGEEYEKHACRDDRGLLDGPSPAGSMPKCVSPFGVYDMTGNVWEWTQSEGFEKGAKYVKGGSWYSFPSVATCALKAWEPPEGGGRDYGFRCALKP